MKQDRTDKEESLRRISIEKLKIRSYQPVPAGKPFHLSVPGNRGGKNCIRCPK
jgi:hypothetical protein